jgi:hypothetical protein
MAPAAFLAYAAIVSLIRGGDGEAIWTEPRSASPSGTRGREAKARGAAIVGIFHDSEASEAVADRLFEIRS